MIMSKITKWLQDWRDGYVRRLGNKGSSCDPGLGREVDQVHISGSLIARNTLLNLIGQVQQLGVLAIPFAVRSHGEASWATA